MHVKSEAVEPVLADFYAVTSKKSRPDWIIAGLLGFLSPGSSQQNAVRRSAVCYEERFFRLWAKRKAQKREEIKPEIGRARPDVQPIRPVPEREVKRRKEVEREFEEIVGEDRR
jgi:hypothetical protein